MAQKLLENRRFRKDELSKVGFELKSHKHALSNRLALEPQARLTFGFM
jgi:hypothetical protein